jgi:hypothetical protein
MKCVLQRFVPYSRFIFVESLKFYAASVKISSVKVQKKGSYKDNKKVLSKTTYLSGQKTLQSVAKWLGSILHTGPNPLLGSTACTCTKQKFRTECFCNACISLRFCQTLPLGQFSRHNHLLFRSHTNNISMVSVIYTKNIYSLLWKLFVVSIGDVSRPLLK